MTVQTDADQRATGDPRSTMRSKALAIDVTAVDGAIVVAVDGELDAYTAPHLRQALREVDGHSDVVLDAARLTFIDSNGLGVLVGAAKRSSSLGHTFSVRATSRTIFRVMEMTRLVEILQVEPPREMGQPR